MRVTLSVFLFFLFINVMAQEKKLVTGNILCEDYCKNTLYPRIGVLVTVEGNKDESTFTDIHGDFQINVSEGATLIFSYLGFETQKKWLESVRLLI